MRNAITEGKDRELPADRHGEILRAPTPAAIELETEVLEAHDHKASGRSDAMRERSSIESRTDLRLAAVNEAMQADPARPVHSIMIEQETARRWADLDATDFGRIRSDSRRENSLEAIAGHMRASPEYVKELQKRSPAIANAAKVLNDERAKVEQDANAPTADRQRQANIAASDQSRGALIDAASLAAVATVRAREARQVVEELARSPDTTTAQLREAQRAFSTPTPIIPTTAAAGDPDLAGQRNRQIKRPVAEDELSSAIRARYIVTHEKRGLLDKGAAEFIFRNGAEQGRVAFVDAGKAISTERQDKATIRAMVEVATSKNWREITVSGTDEFKRDAWLEASLHGIKVRGFEPRDTDKQLLSELQQLHKPANIITAVDIEHQRHEPRLQGRPETAMQRKHVDGDALTVQERTVLDNSRAILDSKALGDQFTAAALKELEAKLRGERVYVGEVVDHGKAPYKFDPNNDESYFVTLKTRAGEQVIWGKGLAEAMQDRQAGEQIVLQNIGKRDVMVNERIRDDKGVVISTRPKESQLNAWKSELLSRFSEKARTDFSNRSAARQPSFGVYDAKAPRAPDERARSPEQHPNPEQKRNSRER